MTNARSMKLPASLPCVLRLRASRALRMRGRRVLHRHAILHPSSSRAGARRAPVEGRTLSMQPSQAQIELADQLVVVELVGGAALERDFAVDDDVAAVGNLDRLGEVLLGHEHAQMIALLE